jgi:hypothetical protein
VPSHSILRSLGNLSNTYSTENLTESKHSTRSSNSNNQPCIIPIITRYGKSPIIGSLPPCALAAKYFCGDSFLNSQHCQNKRRGSATSNVTLEPPQCDHNFPAARLRRGWRDYTVAIMEDLVACFIAMICKWYCTPPGGRGSAQLISIELSRGRRRRDSGAMKYSSGDNLYVAGSCSGWKQFL